VGFDEMTSLLLAARSGDRQALTAWVHRSQAEVWRLCAALVDQKEADDLTQEVFLRAYRSLPRFRAESSARTWLLAIARRTCADAIRFRRRQRRLLSRLGERDGVPLGDAAVVNDLLSGLDHDQRLAFVLTQTLGLSYSEAAVVANCPVGTIRSRVARARDALLTALAAGEAASS